MVSMNSENATLHIKQEDKFYSRLLSKETSVANPSFRVYYGGASGAVPFLWESQPGTPKNAVPTTTLPPLTPPPSYYSTPKRTKSHVPKKSPNLIHALLPKLTLKKTASAPPKQQPPPTHLHFSASSSSSSSSSSLPPYGRTRFSSPRSSFSSRGDDEESEDGSPTSTLCFGVRHGGCGGIKGCYSVMFMKNALLSIVGHGSGQ